MIKFNDIKVGDFLNAQYEDKTWPGEVTHLNRDEKQVCVQTSVQEFWFAPEDLQPIELNEQELLNLHFTKQPNDDGSVKYSKGAFRIVTPHANDFSHFEMWYREDVRHNPQIKYVHQLQNQYLDMTKTHLTREKV